MIKKIKDTWVIFKQRTRLDILVKTYIIMFIVFGVTSVVLNSFYPILLSMSIFSILVIISGISVFIEILEELNKKTKKL